MVQSLADRIFILLRPSEPNRFFIFGAVAMVLLASPASAASERDIRDCEQASDLDLKIASCTRAIASGKLGPVAFTAYDIRGGAWTDKREYDRAITDYSEAIKLNPKFAFAYNNRGITWTLKGEFDRAIADFDEAIRLNPKLAGPYSSRGVAWKEKGDLDRAFADYDEAIRLDAKYATAYLNRGFAWLKMGEYDHAIADFTEVIRLAPNNSLASKAYASRGEVWQLEGDLDRALADQDRAIALFPEGVLIYIKRGDTLRYTGEFRRAIADHEQALRDQPDYVPAFTGLGLIYEKMGDLATARVKFQQALASRSQDRFIGISKSAAETARARLAALDSGIAQPSIPNSLPKATSATSIPTPVISAPTVPAAAVTTTTAKQGRRVALVIGNSDYKNVPVLANPQKDAEAIAASLHNIGFDRVTLANNATRETLVGSLGAFANEAEKADWAMVYYAGHGMEVGGVNYLVPIDARLAVDRDIQFQAVPLDQVLAAVDAAKKLKLVVLDACRDNPFSPRKTEAPASAAATPTAGAKISSRSIGRGLAEVSVTGGTLVVFAAKNGQVALDGDGDNSPFAVAMLQRIATPGVEINKVFRLVRDDVMEATAGRQEPYTYGSLPGREDFFFVEK
jgi:tetratricopeptide (TPR) repeat protein